MLVRTNRTHAAVDPPSILRTLKNYRITIFIDRNLSSLSFYELKKLIFGLKIKHLLATLVAIVTSEGVYLLYLLISFAQIGYIQNRFFLGLVVNSCMIVKKPMFYLYKDSNFFRNVASLG